MKIQIRRGVFETNSSSVHSITMCSKEDYKRWENGELLFHKWNDELVDANSSDVAKKRAEYEKELEKWEDDPNSNSWDRPYTEYLTEDEFWDYDAVDFEKFKKTFTTPSGDEVVAFGYYGHD